MADKIDTNTSASMPELTPIAIMEMGFRFPGGANDPPQLWDMLSQGLSVWSDGLGERFKMEAFYDRDRRRNGCAINPQTYKLTDVAFETFENAVYTKDRISGSEAGVYVAQWPQDYEDILVRDHETRPVHELPGIGMVPLKYCLASSAKTVENLLERLESVQGRSIEPQLSLAKPQLAFVFSQPDKKWHGIGRELLQTPSPFQTTSKQA